MVSISRKSSSRSLEMNEEEFLPKMSSQYVIKHPLQDQWTLWYLEFNSSKTWENMQNSVTSFHTVEDFWSLYNHIVVASALGDGNDYSLFKRNIRPMWEDPANMHGGRWILNFKKQLHRNSLDNLWLDTMLYIIGSTSEYLNEINGAVVNVRSNRDKISVWTANSQNTNAVNGIGRELKEYLGTDATIMYEVHKPINKSMKNLYSL